MRGFRDQYARARGTAFSEQYARSNKQSGKTERIYRGDGTQAQKLPGRGGARWDIRGSSNQGDHFSKRLWSADRL
ncbi:MAG: hypothetical protein ACKO96_33855 [Flammeovirgaceae bacterium]